VVSGVEGAVTRAEVLRWLEAVKDPEIPVISVVELGVVRDVHIDGERVTVDITPTYSGCPAIALMASDIERTLRTHGVAEVQVRTRFEEVWTTDWLTQDAKEKLRSYGIAPPLRTDEGAGLVMLRRRLDVPCPLCGSHETEQKSEFGSTACKAIYVCKSCREPFDYFKSI
jgi:ring-1,2-phenylacetyl-CoA epoxidase subunit PaaD